MALMITEIRKEQNWLIIISLGILALLATGVILVYSRSVLIPFVLAIFIYLLISPILDFQIIKLKMPRGVAIVSTMLIVMVILALLFFLISQAVQMIYSTASRYSDDFINLINRIPSEITIKEMVFDIDIASVTKIIKNNLTTIAADTFGTIRSLASNIIFVSIFLIFLVAGRNPHKIRKGIYGEIDSRVRRYIAMKTVLSLITAVGVWIVFALFGLELAIVFAMLTFILNFIPNIGSLIATCLPIPIAVAQFDNPVAIVMVVVIPGVIQMAIGNVIEPRVMGQGLKLHPIVILLALSFWGLLWGIIGMLLAVPITAAIRIILMQFETLKPLARLLAGQLPGDEKVTE
jgi:AI-2 transport protein TqsA